MALQPNHYLKRAAELDEAAALTSDIQLATEYRDVARRLREMANEKPPVAEQTDADVEQLAERMVQKTSNTV